MREGPDRPVSTATSREDEVASAVRLLSILAPRAAGVRLREPLADDESHWFVEALRHDIVVFEDCPEDCFRRKRWNASGPDHFTTPAGRPRHLFSRPDLPEASLNREYIPHIAAYAYAILAAGYAPARSSFSPYRTFGRDLLEKRAGQSYETDVEFYDSQGGVFLQIEAKASTRQTEALAADVRSANDLVFLRADRAKELEYVLDISPRYLWIVGPGSVDPPRHVFEVHVHDLDAEFSPVEGLPPPPPFSSALYESVS